MAEMKKRKLVLEDGAEYYGEGFGSERDAVCEIVFNTSMVGYQEIISDPSYTYQAVVMTYPLIGNYGIADEDFETKVPSIGGLIVREYNDLPSNFRYTKTLSEVMEEYKIPGLSGVDTRALTRSIRDFGSRRGIITDADTPKEKALDNSENASAARRRGKGKLQEALVLQNRKRKIQRRRDRLRNKAQYNPLAQSERLQRHRNALQYLRR